MSKYVVYIETLDPVTWKVNRDLKPAGYLITKSYENAQAKAREKFKLGNAQQAHLEQNTDLVNRMIKEEERKKTGELHVSR